MVRCTYLHHWYVSNCGCSVKHHGAVVHLGDVLVLNAAFAKDLRSRQHKPSPFVVNPDSPNAVLIPQWISCLKP